MLALATDTELGFPAWLRITHWINAFVIVMLIRSGWEIIASHPRFYWNNHCTPGSEWIKFTKDKVPLEESAFTARDDQRSLSPLISCLAGIAVAFSTYSKIPMHHNLCGKKKTCVTACAFSVDRGSDRCYPTMPRRVSCRSSG